MSNVKTKFIEYSIYEIFDDFIEYPLYMKYREDECVICKRNKWYKKNLKIAHINIVDKKYVINIDSKSVTEDDIRQICLLVAKYEQQAIYSNIKVEIELMVEQVCNIKIKR